MNQIDASEISLVYISKVAIDDWEIIVIMPWSQNNKD